MPKLKPGQAYKKSATFRLSDETQRQLAEIQDVTGQTKTEAIRRAVGRYYGEMVPGNRSEEELWRSMCRGRGNHSGCHNLNIDHNTCDLTGREPSFSECPLLNEGKPGKEKEPAK